jgi:hypothetical protein
MPCRYTNKKGRVIGVAITEHAVNKCIKRYGRLHGVELTAEEALLFIEHSFNSSERVLNSSYRHRMRNHEGSSLYFKSDGFVFVVEDGTMVTVEIASKRQRCLN